MNEELKQTKEKFETERRQEISQIVSGLNRLRETRRKVIGTASKARSKLVAIHTKLQTELDQQFHSRLDELTKKEQKDVKELDRQIKHLERNAADLATLINSFSVKSLVQSSPERILIPDEIRMTYSLHAYSVDEIEVGQIGKLLGNVNSKRFECTVPITGKGQRYIMIVLSNVEKAIRAIAV